MSAIHLLKKTPSEKRLYNFDFALKSEIEDGTDSISAAAVTQSTISGSGTLTIGSVSVSGTKAQVLISGGTAGARYQLNCLADLASGSSKKLEIIGLLDVYSSL